MNKTATVFVHVWTGRPGDAARAISRDYSDHPIRFLSYRELWAGGWKGQLHALRSLKGAALVFYFDSIQDITEPQFIPWTGLIHRCCETVITDKEGNRRVYRRSCYLALFPAFLFSACCDAVVLAASWLALRTAGRRLRPVPFEPQMWSGAPDLDVAYLYPFPLGRANVGGAMTHVRGVLQGLAAQRAKCEIFTGLSQGYSPFRSHHIPAKKRFYLVKESLLISYHLRFCLKVLMALQEKSVQALYQRHGSFTIAGALLSQWLRVPLVLEYNGSEAWMARHWGQPRFSTWLGLFEDCALSSASLIVAVSEALREELLSRGIPSERILVNPNAVDPQSFRPACGGKELRKRLGFMAEDVIVGFVGSFSYWHGIPVLQDAIQQLLGAESHRSQGRPVRFLLVGSGVLHHDLQRACAEFERVGAVVFAGAIPHDWVPAYLDAADILVSPHIPMPDGRPFIGSPTKLFEYMAMGKAIIASDLDQIGRVLRHRETAWLVTPGDANQLVAAIRLLASQPETRNRLGKAAREAAMARHTWSQNATRLLARLELMNSKNELKVPPDGLESAEFATGRAGPSGQVSGKPAARGV